MRSEREVEVVASSALPITWLDVGDWGGSVGGLGVAHYNSFVNGIWRSGVALEASFAKSKVVCTAIPTDPVSTPLGKALGFFLASRVFSLCETGQRRVRRVEMSDLTTSPSTAAACASLDTCLAPKRVIAKADLGATASLLKTELEDLRATNRFILVARSSCPPIKTFMRRLRFSKTHRRSSNEFVSVILASSD
jgi:hypothetical protein